MLRPKAPAPSSSSSSSSPALHSSGRSSNSCCEPCPSPSTSTIKGQRRVVAAAGLLSATVQDAIMGGAVLATAGAAAWAVGRGDAPEGCSLCQGTGGCSCFACSGSGGNPSSSTSNSSSSLPPLTMEEVTAAREENDPANGKPSRRDFFGRAPRRVGARGAGLQCRVCGGTGLVLCSQCKGSGFTRI